MTLQATSIDGGFQSVYDTANGKTYYVENSLWPTNGAGMTQSSAAEKAEFILSSAGDWWKKPADIRTHDVLEGFIAHRAGVSSVSEVCPPEVSAALDALNAAFATAWP